MKKLSSLLAIAIVFVAVAVQAQTAPTQTATVKLTWQDNSSNEDGFIIERSLGGPDNFSQLTKVGADVVSYTDVITDDPGNRQLCYRLAGFNAAGTSAFSNIACATTPAIIVPPNTPGNVSITVTVQITVNP